MRTTTTDPTADLIRDLEKATRDYASAVDPKLPPLGPWAPLLYALNVPGDRALLRRLCDCWETDRYARARIAQALIGNEHHRAVLGEFFTAGGDA